MSIFTIIFIVKRDIFVFKHFIYGSNRPALDKLSGLGNNSNKKVTPHSPVLHQMLFSVIPWTSILVGMQLSYSRSYQQGELYIYIYIYVYILL